jgi:AmmeMemoRadiSam system protein A
MTLLPTDRATLLELARQAVARAAHGQEPSPVDLNALSDELRRDGASFVTLTKRGELRGCIGSLEARRPLALDVQENGANAATKDPRFPAVRPDELDALAVEVSVLSVPQPLQYDGPEDLVAKLRPGVDGVVIERGWNRATFLPQVWEKIPDPHDFLRHLCVKAYLPGDSYTRPGLDVYTYQVLKIEERSR